MGRGSRSALHSAVTAARPRATLGLRSVADPDDTPLAAYKRKHLNIRDVTDPAQAAAIITQIRAAGHPISVDFETARLDDTFGVASGTIRLAQLGLHDPVTGARRQYLLDLHAADLREPLRALMADPQIQKLIHFSRFEQEHSIYHLGTSIKNVYDTHAAWQSVQKVLGQILKRKNGCAQVDALLPGWQRTGLGLADVTFALQGLQIPKDEQSSDWSGPLTASQREYAATDVSLPHDLAPRLRELVSALGLDEEVTDKCVRREQSTAAKWTAELLDELSHGREVCWQLLDAADVAGLDRIWDQSRRRPVSAPHRDELTGLYQRRRGELAELAR